MSIWNIDQQTFDRDVMGQRIASGTVGGSHMVPSGVGSGAISNIVSALDTRVTVTGTWTGHINSTAFAIDFLGENLQATGTGATISVPFSGTTISVIGVTGPDGGRADVTVDGVSTSGRVNTYTQLAASYYNGRSTGGLNSTDTTLNVADTTSFLSSGSVIVDGEVISYTSTTATTFAGCTRGASSTTAMPHNAGATIYQYNSAVEFYSQYRQSRVVVWNSNNLTPGDHTLTLTVRSDKNASSTSTVVYINGFGFGGQIGAPNLNTYIENFTFSTLTTDANGNTTAVTFRPNSADRQLLSVLGCYNITGPSVHAVANWNPSTNTVIFKTDTVSGTASIVMSAVMLGPSY